MLPKHTDKEKYKITDMEQKLQKLEILKRSPSPNRLCSLFTKAKTQS